MKKFDVTLQLVARYDDEGEPILHLERHEVLAENETNAIEIAKNQSTSLLSIYDCYADEID